MESRLFYQRDLLIGILDASRKMLEESDLDTEELRDIAGDIRESVGEQAGIVVNIAQQEINNLKVSKT